MKTLENYRPSRRKAFRDTYVYNGNYSHRRKKYFGVHAANPFSQFVVFAQNHDQIGNRAKGDRLAVQSFA